MFNFNFPKTIQMVKRILQNNGGILNYTKLIKLLYIIEKESLNVSGRPVSGDDYVSMDNGPVLSTVYDLIKGKCLFKKWQTEWDNLFKTNVFDLEYKLALTNEIEQEFSELNEEELELIDNIDNRFKDFNWNEMKQYTHNKELFPEWEYPYGSSNPIKIIDILKNLRKTDEEISNIIKDANELKYIEKVLSK